jgi:NAD(P)-dependent dehydrogenase (short-subunit alcohol dehydrogenase family)
MGQLDGKVAIITGGARGIGRAYVLGFAREGAAVAVADAGDAKSVVDEVEAAGGQAMAVQVDVTDESSTARMAEAVRERFGTIDILVNNAGHFRYAKRGPFTDIPVDEWDLAFDVNVRGTWLCAKAVYPTMRDKGSGKIVNISSMTAWKGNRNFLHYVASKAAIVGLTRALALEVGEHNINVNTLVPEYIPHDLEYAVDLPGIDEKIVAQRVFKRTQVPEDMVGAAIFLSSAASDFITGQSLLVNGGTQFQ